LRAASHTSKPPEKRVQRTSSMIFRLGYDGLAPHNENVPFVALVASTPTSPVF
jgi:hypothetical protein